jgi:hypothetical protein
MVSRQIAAGTSRGGRMTSQTATARPAANKRPTETTCPAVPIEESKCPGSRLSAGVL